MLPDLEDLAKGLAHIRLSLHRDALLTGFDHWMSTSADAATYLILNGIAGTGPGHEHQFRTQLTQAATRHTWSTDFVAQVINAANAVYDLVASSSYGRPRVTPDVATELAQQITRFPAFLFEPGQAGGSALGGLTVGRTIDSNDYTLPPGSAVVASRPGGGKHSLIHNVIAGIAQSCDATAWVADTDGGGLLAPWLQTEHTRRLIGWAAVGADAVRRMCGAALQLVEHRKVHGARAMMAADSDMFQISPAEPIVYVVIDGLDVLDHEASAAVRRLQRIGGAMRVFVIGVTCRATPDHLPTEMLRNADVRLAGPLDDPAEYRWMFQRTEVPAEPDQPGVFLVQSRDGDLIRFRPPLLRPTEIAQLGESLADAGHQPASVEERSMPADAARNYGLRWQHPDVTKIIETF